VGEKRGKKKKDREKKRRKGTAKTPSEINF